MLAFLVLPWAARAAPPASDAAALPDPVEAAYQFALAKMLADESAFGEAQEAFERALELDDSDPYGYVELASFHSDLSYMTRSTEGRRQQLLKAAEYAGKALERAPENADVLRVYAQIHLRLGEHQMSSLGLAESAFEKLRGLTEGDLQVLTSLGQIYLWRQQPEKAAEVLQEAASYLPGHRMIHSMLVDALLDSGNLEGAEPALAKLLEIDPSSLENRLKLADIKSQKDDHRGAVEVLRAAPEANADDPRLRRSLARELHLAGMNDEALALVDKLLAEGEGAEERLRRLRIAVLTSLARYPDAIAELQPQLAADTEPARRLQDEFLLSRLLERVGRSEEAVERLRVQLAHFDGDEGLQIVLSLAGALERQGGTAEAIELVAAQLDTATAPHRAMLAPLLAGMLARDGRGDEGDLVLARAAAALREAGEEETALGLELRRFALLAEDEDWSALESATAAFADHENPDVRKVVRQFRADALVGLDRVGEALELLATGEPDDRQLLAKRIEILFDHGRAEDAAALVDEIAGGGQPEDLFFAARLYQQAERYGEVVTLVKRLLEAEPASVEGLFLLGAAQERRGDPAAAAAAFERLLDEAPDHAPTLNYLGYMWADRGEKLEEARTLILQAVALDPDNGAYVDSLGWAEYRLGRWDEARQHLEWASRLLPTDPTIFEHLGDLYLGTGDTSRAREHYRKALELDGENVDQVRRKLEDLDDQDV